MLESRPGRGHQESASVLAAIAAAARDYLWVTNAYFAPRALAIHALGRAVARGVDVRLLLPGKSDLSLVRHAGHGYFRELLRRGVRIFEYQGAILHAKTLVADDYLSLVGSSNLDFRSFHFNAEANLVVMDESAANDMAAAFREDLSRAAEIKLGEWDDRAWFHKIGDGVTRHLYPLL